MRKDVRMKRHKCTNSEREYVRGIVHNLSFQRWTDKDIAIFLNEEKKIEISRSTVSRIRKKVEKQAEKWYIELRNSTFKYIAIYKDRIDSLFSYQKKLHEIISATNKPEVQIRAISELHSIEMSIFNLWKQLPALDIVDDHKSEEYQYDQRKMRDKIGLFFGWRQGDPPLNGHFRKMMEEKYGADTEPWDDPNWIQCPSCKRWLKNTDKLEMHTGRYCIPEPIV